MRTILLNINPDPGHEARLAAAISLAKSQSGHIDCLQTIIQPLAIGGPESAVVVPEMMEAVEWSAGAFREAVEARLEAAGVEWSWDQLFGDPATIIVSHARLADVVILSAEGYYPSVGSVALHARIPILAVPEKGVPFHVQPPALIAWNGSHPAANALRASLPLLRNAGAVHVLVVDDESEKFPAARALDYLSHHAITSEAHRVHSDSRTVAETILTLAGRIEAGLVVAGAFGHNRIREMLLGSVTRLLVKDSPLPLLLAH